MHGVPQERELGARTVQLFPIFHPAAALRTPAVKEQLREDFARLPALLERAVRAAGSRRREAAGTRTRGPVRPARGQLGLSG